MTAYALVVGPSASSELQTPGGPPITRTELLDDRVPPLVNLELRGLGYVECARGVILAARAEMAAGRTTLAVPGSNSFRPIPS